MRESLLKKRYGVPGLLLIAMLLSAGTATAFLVATFTYTANTDEPLLFQKTDGLDIPYQGDSDTIIVHVQNLNTETGYGIFVNTTLENEQQIESMSYSENYRVASELVANKDFNGDHDKVDAKYNINKGFAFDIVLTIDTVDNAAPRGLAVTLNLSREYKYTQG